MNKCLCKFYVSVTRKENSCYNPKTSLLSFRAALDHNLKSPPHNKKFRSATTMYLFTEANKELNSYLKQLISEGNLQTSVNRRSHHVNKKLCNKMPSLTLVMPARVLHQTAWFISIYFGKRVGETQHSFTEVSASSQ